eukprot:6482860-Amphidinium_carterae.1
MSRLTLEGNCISYDAAFRWHPHIAMIGSGPLNASYTKTFRALLLQRKQRWRLCSLFHNKC